MSPVNPNVVEIPASFTAAEKQLLMTANGGAVFVDHSIMLSPAALTPAGEVPAGSPVAGPATTPAAAHAGVLSTILKLVKAAADYGLPIILPGALGAFVDKAIDVGVDEAISAIDAGGITERWTVDRIANAKASVAEPTT